MKEFNSMVFSKNEREQMFKMLNVLLEFNDVSNDSFNDIHIRQEDMFNVLEWVQVAIDHSWGGAFEYLAEDEYKTKEVIFPDNSIAYILPEDVDEVMKEWEEANQDYLNEKESEHDYE